MKFDKNRIIVKALIIYIAFTIPYFVTTYNKEKNINEEFDSLKYNLVDITDKYENLLKESITLKEKYNDLQKQYTHDLTEYNELLKNNK